MSTPISLVMTVYNRAHYLPLALDSVINQTYPHWHLTIWDDGSSDGSQAIARQYANFDRRIRFIPAPHQGRQYALRAAIQSTEYPYLGWLDSDDLLAPETLAKTVAILDTQRVGMVYTDHWEIDDRGLVRGVGKRSLIPYSQERLLVDFMTFHFRLIRREVYEEVGGIDLDFPQAQDYDLCLKISEVTDISHLSCPPEGVTSTP